MGTEYNFIKVSPRLDKKGSSIVGVAIAIVILGSFILGIWKFGDIIPFNPTQTANTPPMANITQINLYVSYPNDTWTEYFGNTMQTLSYKKSVIAGSSFAYTLHLTNWDSNIFVSHGIDRISVAPLGTLSLPQGYMPAETKVGEFGTITENLTIQTSNQPYTGPLDISINVS